MNLELIKKYEKEFLHMIHGGPLLFRNPSGDWYQHTKELFTLNSDSVTDIVIDDIYRDYRKAEAEGKTIEYSTIANYKYPITRMDELEVLIKANHSGKYIFRIKPEEPEFKVGDWITVNGPAGTFTECVSGINDDTYTLSGTDICFKSQATKWEPKEGEICIFWDDNWVTKAIIIKFNYINNSNQYTAIDNICWDNCMPFTGVLPPHMKDN